MKKLLLMGMLLCPAAASASDYATVFNITGDIGGAGYTKMRLDITRHRRFLAVNGAVETNAGIGSPLSGTCQFAANGGVFCVLQNGFVNYILDLGPNLNGTMRASDGLGSTFATVAITFAGME